MTAHLSAKLIWHDQAWNGCVCNNPARNPCCVMQQDIRDARYLDREMESAGLPLSDWREGKQPPCSRGMMTFSPTGSTIYHSDPLYRGFSPLKDAAPPYSLFETPYRWLMEERCLAICEAEKLDIPPGANPNKQGGWIDEPQRQLPLLKRFWEKPEKGKSLVFFYCDGKTPVDDTLKHLVVGVGRISNIGPQLFYDPDKNACPVWHRCVTHDFANQGFRLPYHEYLEKGYDLPQIVCTIPDRSTWYFSHFAEHVSDDVAVDILQTAKLTGDSLLAFSDLIDRIKRHFPDRRACIPDRDLVAGDAEFYSKKNSVFRHGLLPDASNRPFSDGMVCRLEYDITFQYLSLTP